MSSNEIKEQTIYIPSSKEGALRQGEILSGLIEPRIEAGTLNSKDGPLVIPITHTFVIIATQDCDLDWDYQAREKGVSPHKLIPSILFCEVTTAEKLKGRNDLNSNLWGRVKINKDERYHFLQKVTATEDALGEGLQELGIDFKRYFTVPTNEVYNQLKSTIKRRCRLASPYLEHFSTLFCYYQFRVALPADHLSEP